MRVCLKKALNIGKIRLEKHREAYLIGIEWNESGNFQYIVDFGKEGRHTVDASEMDILNCR